MVMVHGSHSEVLKMKKSELILRLAERADITTPAAADIISIIFDSIASTLERGDRVEVRGFGTFSVKDCGSYLGRNPRDGSHVQVPPKKKVVWKAGKGLHERVNSSDLN